MNRAVLIYTIALLAACGSDTSAVQSYIARTDGVMRMIVERSGHTIDLVNESRNTENDLRNKLKSYSQFATYHERAAAWMQASPVPPPCAEYHKAVVGALEALVEIRATGEELDEMQLMGVTGTGVPSAERIDGLSRRGQEATDRMKQHVDNALKVRESLVKEFGVPVGRDGAAIRPKDKPYDYYDFQV